jgi:hypothetical protein
MRAEHASVVAVALPLSQGDKRKRTLAAAAALGIPAVPARRLIEATADHGHLIPREMQPPDLMPNKRKAPGPHRDARLNAVADGVGHRRHR